MTFSWKNKLFFGDNLDIMRNYLQDESVDLIYLDPPFNSKASYNVLFQEKNGSSSPAQITAFEDTWHWDMKAEGAFHEIVTGKRAPAVLIDLIRSLRSFLGQNDMMAYLVMMANRIIEMHRILKPTGKLFLHCDQTASHYLKIITDAVFGIQNFRNDIIWTYQKWGRVLQNNLGYQYQNILFYGKSQSAFINEYPAKEWSSKEEYVKIRKQKVRIDENKKEYVLSDAGGGKRVKRFLEEAMQYGRPISEVWDDIPNLTSSAKERLGYPTQKPEGLLERIVKMGSSHGDLVLDPFCGCGTSIAVSERLGRKWIGIDITHLAITLMKHRLKDTFGKDLRPYEIFGVPKDINSAHALAEHDRYQFEWWACGLVDARPAQDKKKGADRGIDGVIYFFDDDSEKAKKIIVQIKSGSVKRGDIATLKGDVEREEAVIGVFITLKEPTRPMIEDAASAGFYDPPHIRFKAPKIQILTVEELLAGKQVEYPKGYEATFKKARFQSKMPDKSKGLMGLIKS
jgi:site-specific DNA-methyltransferase (adenine-specific)